MWLIVTDKICNNKKFHSLIFRLKMSPSFNCGAWGGPSADSFNARSSYASTVLGIVILSVCPSVRMSVTRVLCDETKEHTADILLPHERVITLVFYYQQRLVVDVPLYLKFALKLTHTFAKHRLLPISAYNNWTVRASEKCLIIVNRKSTTRFPTSYRWSAYVTPNYPKGLLKKRICRFCE